MANGVPDPLSIVIPALNEEGRISGQLDALARQQYGGVIEVVVADNGSTDGTVEKVRAWPGSCVTKVVDASAHRGVAAARNVGVAHSSYDRILICDADDEVDPGGPPP